MVAHAELARDFRLALAALQIRPTVAAPPAEPVRALPPDTVPQFLIETPSGIGRRMGIVLGSCGLALVVTVLYFVAMR